MRILFIFVFFFASCGSSKLGRWSKQDKSLAREVGSRGITVNTIAPGYIATDMTKDISEELNKTMMNNIPLKRFGKPEDIAKAALYLASSAGSYITGQTLHVNGGMHME